MKKKCTLGSADKLLLLAVLLLLAALTALFGSLIKSVHSQKKICQSVVSLGKYEYNASFLEQAEKLAGIRSITPVCEVSVTLKTDGYTMDTILTGVDTSELLMCVKDSQEVMLGNTPALLIGEKCLSSLTDANGQTVSEKKEKEILENYRELTWEYRLTGAGQEISGGAGSDSAVQDGEERNSGTQDGTGIQSGAMQSSADSGVWKPCTVAAILSEPKKDIYIPYHQAAALTAGSRNSLGDMSISKILLTVQGEENYKKAAELFK